MPFRRPWISILGLAVVLLMGSSALATQILPLSTQQLADGSPTVVRGTVVEERSYWNDAKTRILTEVEIEVAQSFKGSAPTRLRVVQMGGIVGTTKMTVAGALSWRTGEEVVLFLEPSLPGISAESVQTSQLSTCKPASAASRCSMTSTVPPAAASVVRRGVSTWFASLAGMRHGGERSFRRNTMPVPAGAGRISTWTSFPVRWPIPLSCTGLAIVRC